jgi:hypothetical protein
LSGSVSGCDNDLGRSSVQYLGRDYDSKAESLHTEVQSVMNVARL